MFINLLHLLTILTTFTLTLMGKVDLAVITFVGALVLSFFIVFRRGKYTKRRKNNKPVNNGEVDQEELTDVIISKTYGGRKGVERFYQTFRNPNEIEIERGSGTNIRKSNTLMWCWIFLLLCLATWGTYNFVYRDEPYVPLTRVYKNLVQQPRSISLHKQSSQSFKVVKNSTKKKERILPPTNTERQIAKFHHQSVEVPVDKARRGKIYTWVDEDGITHHSNVLPSGNLNNISSRSEIRSSYDSTPIKLHNGRPLIPITIRHNNKSIDFEIIVDTGCTTTIIPNEIADYLKPKYLRKTYSNVADGRKVEGKLVMVDAVTIGPKSVRNIEVITGRVAGAANKGLLGMNFIKHHPFYLDIENKRLHWK